MSCRIHFTAEDLARTRIADVPQPLFELSIAVRMLQENTHSVAFGAWRREVRGRLRPRDRLVLDLIPSRGWSPGFLHVGSPTGDVAEALEAARSLPRRRILDELEFIAALQGLPLRARRLRDDPRMLGELFDSLGRVHEQVLAPYWPRIRTRLEADRAVRLREFSRGGVERVLAGLNPRYVTWRPPVLEIVMVSGYDEDLYLEGQGLLLAPSWFGCVAPVVDWPARPQPMLVYPAHRDAHGQAVPTAPLSGATPAALETLLGRTRAAVLYAIADSEGCTTTELAQRTGVALASASEHTAVLRAAGLV
ncbi:MarR family transcriptional regulator, partial [Streptomyces sp. NPDC049577]|uniref:ArsR/SmtB family transcription factor n=1 Tax=Streptomyces sp. NPDC049577 TaxID=3155153 RepID=UPI00342C60F9